jgi:selenocysteine lyase/cysteine desulfurase
LEAALDYVSGIGIETIEAYNFHLTTLLRERLEQAGTTLITPPYSRSPITAFFIDDEVGFGKQMRERGILFAARQWKQGMIRISPHFYNTENDIEAFMEAYKRIIK